jgi:hypothetical protein
VTATFRVFYRAVFSHGRVGRPEAPLVIHDRDTIDSEGVDRTLDAIGLAVLKPPARVPQAAVHGISRLPIYLSHIVKGCRKVDLLPSSLTTTSTVHTERGPQSSASDTAAPVTRIGDRRDLRSAWGSARW